MAGEKDAALRYSVSLRMGETIIAEQCTGDGLPIFSADTGQGPWRYSSHFRVRNRRGTIVIGARGSIGNPRLPDYDEFGATQTTIVATPDREKWDSAYLLHALSDVRIGSVVTQQAIPMLTVNDLGRLVIHCPKLTQQRLVADILAAAAQAVCQTEATIAKYRQVRAGLMHDLFTRGVTSNGELRPARSEAPKLYKQSPLGWIPTDWDLIRLGKLSSRLTGRLIVQPHQYFAEVGVPIVFGTNLRDGKIITDDLERISFEADARFAQYRVRAGDLLTVRVGVPGMTAVVPPELDGCHFASIMLIRKTDKADSQWLSYCMNSELIRRQIEMANYGSVQTQFNISDARLFRLAAPALPEQEQIVERVRSIDAQIEAEESHLGKLETVKAGLMHDLLTGRVRVPIANDGKVAANG